MNLDDLKIGTIIKSQRWEEPIEIKRVDQLEGYIHIIGSTITNNQHIDQLIPVNELNTITIEKIECNFTGDPTKVFLAFETKRYRYASLYDPLLAVNVSKIAPLPHQIEAVYGYILKLPRIRFLIADDPGAGKTIMAALIIKELKFRTNIERILIVCPGHLIDQWRRELKDRFEENFVVIHRGYIDSHFGENVWQKENQIIASIDFSKQEDILPALSSTDFDLVIIDEAHKLSAYKYGEVVRKTIRYKLGEILSKISNHLIFLTATPHKGDPENFRLFLDLLEPGFFATTKMLEESIRNKDNPLFIRRVKEDLKTFDGEPIFLKRYIQTLKYRLSDSEKRLYNDVSRYVHFQYNKALRKNKRRYIAFALVILQRRLASSTYALLQSLKNRKKKLEELEEKSEIMSYSKPYKFDAEDLEDMSEEDRWKEEEIWETLSVAENRAELRSEIQTLEQLITKARLIIENEEEKKLSEFKKSLLKLEQSEPNQKIIVFTESRKTLEYLTKKATSWGYSIVNIHGGMKLEQRVAAEKIFKHEKQVLIATEAAGEGINLQFCHLMINYDIPWNPNRLEQRMGRIHRYGQPREVFIFNLVAEDTREGAVLVRLFEKLDEIKKNLGEDKVFDVIGTVFFGKNLEHLLVDAASGAKTREEVLKEIDITVDEEYITKIKEELGETLATRYIDYTHIKEMADKAKENKLIPEYTEEFFKKAFSILEGKITKRKDGLFTIESIPFDLRNIAQQENFKRRFGAFQRRYNKATFDKDIAFKISDTELITFGHPLFEALLEYIEGAFSNDMKTGAVYIDPQGELDGFILLYEGEIKDGKPEPNNVAGKRLFTIYINPNEVKSISPTIFWELVAGEIQEENIDLNSLKHKALTNVLEQMEKYKEKKQEERNREANVKEKYGLKSMNHLIHRLDGDLIKLYSRKERGENVDLAIRNKQEQKRKYELGMRVLQDQIAREKTLTMQIPNSIGIIRVKPPDKVFDYMKSNKEIEEVGMKVSMEYERKNSRTPEDVSSEDLGFDIRSTDKEGGIRYIEVKARAGIGSVVLTHPEWFKAKRFGNDYYLYAVLNASKKPELHIIRNPTESIDAEEIIEIVRYLVPSKQITKVGEKVE